MIRASLTSGALGHFFFRAQISVSAEMAGDSWRSGKDGIGGMGKLPRSSSAAGPN
jgi:hypothetical protein